MAEILDNPLGNLRVLVLGSPQTSTKLAARLERWGARIIPFRAIEMHKLKDPQALRGVFDRLAEYTWIIFTSSYGVLYFMEHLADRGINKHKIEHARICAVGPATASTAVEKGLRVDLVPGVFVAEGILKAFEEQPGGLGALNGCRILMPRAKEARDILSVKLTAAGARVDVLPCYETVKAAVEIEVVKDLFSHPPDLAVFTSSSNVENFLAIVGFREGLEMLRRSVTAALGPITAATLEHSGKKPEIIPEENTVSSLEQAIRAYYSKRKGLS